MNALAPMEPWICSKCHAQNFGSHLTCLRCGAEKPITTDHYPLQVPTESTSQHDGTDSPVQGVPTPEQGTILESAQPRLEDTQPTLSSTQAQPQIKPTQPLTPVTPALTQAKPQPVPSTHDRVSAAPKAQKSGKPNRFLASCGLLILCLILCLAALYFGRAWLVAHVPILNQVSQLVGYLQPTAELETSLVEQAPMPTATRERSTIQPTLEVSVPAQEQLVISYAGVSFSYEKQLAREVVPLTQPAVSEPAIVAAPEYYLFEFNGYPDEDISTIVPEVRIYPAPEYMAINPDAGDQIERLKQALRVYPDLLNEPLPYLPMIPAGQLITARVELLVFQNGTGLRYLTQFAQDVYPINNTDLMYTFQGLTTDSKYYISASFPIQSISLPGKDSLATYDYQEFVDSFPAYATNIIRQLEQESASSFVPDMDLLDAMMQTLLVGK